MEIFFKLLADNKCINCNKRGELLCKKCCVSLLPSNLSKEKINNLSVVYLYGYKGVVRKLIKRAKFGTKEFAVLKQLVKVACSTYKSDLAVFSDYICVPIPVSKQRLLERGFNQASILAKEISKNTRILCLENVLFRVVDTQHQYALHRLDRMKNMKNVFIVNADKVQNKKILLVDDICTTGSTLLEAAFALYNSGAKEVCALALSRGHRRV